MEVARFGVPPLRASCDPNTKLGLRLGCVWVASGLRLGCVWVASGLHLGCVWVASGLRLGCVWVASGLRLDFQEKFSLRQKFETITYLEVARFGVPPLRTTCDPNTNLRFQEKFSLRQKFEHLTGDNNLNGSGTFQRATSSRIETITYLEVARFGVPPLRVSCDPNTKLGLRLGCVWVTSGLRLGCVWVASGLRLGCVWVASGLRLGCVWVASGLRLDFQEKFSLRQKFVKLTGDNNLRGSGTFRRATSSHNM
ncbi:hypothetical protein V1477_016952 [Vespula maculifrons]|uniref:Uncharacterized protein n=1 Tax=Vespula maculifrons TaxID=7453 RepID=A0ABD2B4N9_VESMC